MKECFVARSFRADSLERISQANEIIERYQDMGLRLTLRQLYYQHVAANLIPNSERSYKNLASLVSDGRLTGLIRDALEDVIDRDAMDAIVAKEDADREAVREAVYAVTRGTRAGRVARETEPAKPAKQAGRKTTRRKGRKP